MVFVQVELKHTAQVQDLIGFLLARSYNSFRVTEQDLFLAGSSTSTNVSWGSCKLSPRASVDPMQGECPTLPEAASEYSMIPAPSSPFVDRKPIAVEIIDEDENDLSIDHCDSFFSNEVEDKPGNSGESQSNGQAINRKRKWTSANELALFGSMKQFNLNVSILKRRQVLGHTAQCSICEKPVQATPRVLALHCGTKHMDLRSYRCAICQYAASIKGNVIKHIKHHASLDPSLVDGPMEQYIESNLITIPFTKEQCDKIKDLVETCFAVKTSERV